MTFFFLLHRFRFHSPFASYQIHIQSVMCGAYLIFNTYLKTCVYHFICLLDIWHLHRTLYDTYIVVVAIVLRTSHIVYKFKLNINAHKSNILLFIGRRKYKIINFNKVSWNFDCGNNIAIIRPPHIRQTDFKKGNEKCEKSNSNQMV